jgi:hypothetical protein
MVPHEHTQAGGWPLIFWLAAVGGVVVLPVFSLDRVHRGARAGQRRWKRLRFHALGVALRASGVVAIAAVAGVRGRSHALGLPSVADGPAALLVAGSAVGPHSVPMVDLTGSVGSFGPAREVVAADRSVVRRASELQGRRFGSWSLAGSPAAVRGSALVGYSSDQAAAGPVDGLDRVGWVADVAGSAAGGLVNALVGTVQRAVARVQDGVVARSAVCADARSDGLAPALVLC